MTNNTIEKRLSMSNDRAFREHDRMLARGDSDLFHEAESTADSVIVYCTHCDEEYEIPEDSVQCPICSNYDTIEEV